MRELRLENIVSWPKSAQLFLMFVVYIIILSAIYFFHAQSKLALLNANKNRVVILKRDIEAKEMKITEWQAEADSKPETKVSEISKQISISQLMASLSKLSANHQVRFDAVKPLPLHQSNGFSIQPLKIVAISHYQQILQFVRALTSLPVLSIIEDFSLIPVPKTDGILQLTMIMNTYSENKQ